MADKEKLKAGLANIISGADQSVTKKYEAKSLTEAKEATTQESEAPSMVVEPTSLQDGVDLINSIEDDELRKELYERLLKKRMIGRGRPRKNDINGRSMDGYDRTSIIINVEKWAKIKEIALRETLTLKEIVELALDMIIGRYEEKNGEVKPQQRIIRDIKEIF